MKTLTLAFLALPLALGSCDVADVPTSGVGTDETTAVGVTTPAPPAPKEILLVDGESALQRVVVIGASMSDGFGLQHGLDELLDTMIHADHDYVEQSASELFFMNPMGMGPDALELASDLDPTLLVAVDFLFWYGYGAANADGQPLGSEDERLDLLEVGLGLLDDVGCPLMVGDFPNMANAVGGMLLASQLPAPATLDRLNERLYAWADERPGVSIVPLAEAVTALRADVAFELGRLSYPAGSTTRLLQRDHLHPTLEGLAVIAHLIGVELIALGLAAEEDLDLSVPAALDALGG